MPFTMIFSHSVQGVLDVYAHAPSPCACMELLAVLVHYLTPDGGRGGGEGVEW